MTTLYVVSDGDYSDYRVLGIYSDKDRAARAVDLYNAENDIEEYELNALPDAPPGLVRWLVEMDRDGNTRRVWRTGVDTYGGALDWSIGWTPGGYQSVFARPMPPTGPCISYSVWAADEAHAVKVANERRTRLIADDLWTVDESRYRKIYNAAAAARKESTP